jgi:SAM-dependent methyltransferase
MSNVEHDRIRQAVRASYGAVARASGSGCCGTQPASIAGQRLGYAVSELADVPEGANLGLGCGNPQAIADLKPGETVLDLGSGAGFDCFLAARAVGEHGQVIGVDMTPDMISKARGNAQQGGYDNVEFRLGEIESLPVADNLVDIILSNCVINLSADKGRVFREAFRVLKPGGRLAISDVVATAVLPDEVRRDAHLYSCCIGGAALIDELEAHLQAAGFTHIRIQAKDESREFIRDWAPGRGIEDYVLSATIEAIKPGGSTTMDSTPVPELHKSIVALVSLAANIASNHPKQGLCQVDRLKEYGVAREQIDSVIEIARHIRDEAGQKLDAQFDEAYAACMAPAKPAIKPDPFANIAVQESGGACCTPTQSGKSCC